MEQVPDAVAILAERNAALRFEHLPVSTVLATKRLILDLLGIAYPGFAARAVPELHSVLTATYGAAGNARIWGSAGRLPAPEAALLNSAAAHALDFDDTHDRGPCRRAFRDARAERHFRRAQCAGGPGGPVQPVPARRI